MCWFDGFMPTPSFMDPTNVEDLIWSFGSFPVDQEEGLALSHGWGSMAYDDTFLV
jgi:hypothetical protein